MSDPRLCSIHLEALPRRQDYRRAREALLGACGQRTLALDHGHLIAAAAIREASASAEAAAVPSKYWLADKDAVYPLKVGLNTIGRMPDNDVAVLDASVSRRHCAIVVHVDCSCEVHDTASKNGTFVNGQRIGGPTPVRPGDELRLCDRTLMFLANESDAPPKDDDAKTFID